ncbi:MAG: helix-hairpin-helix domain-containing protein [Candidatus Thermoplasmatota archaeon]|nr:helix-hairpin-helix domain-containing protein [Candidatus Thermoplasmatota archaeon]
MMMCLGICGSAELKEGSKLRVGAYRRAASAIEGYGVADIYESEDMEGLLKISGVLGVKGDIKVEIPRG